MPENELASIALQPTGETFLTPPLHELAQNDYRITLEGVFTFSHSGMEFDPVYKRGPNGQFDQPHNYLQWTPRTPPLDEQLSDPIHHRYVFRIPKEWGLEGRSVGVKVDVDAFVNEF